MIPEDEIEWEDADEVLSCAVLSCGLENPEICESCQ